MFTTASLMTSPCFRLTEALLLLMNRIKELLLMFRTILLAAVVVASFSALQAAELPPFSIERVHSSIARMQEAHLRAAHEDVARIQAQRQAVALKVGLNDYRTILHAHAQDASHTGGTRPEMLADAKRMNVKIIFLSNHHRPPSDFMETWRGIHEGVLFIPGSESNGHLIHPVESVMDKMNLKGKEFVEAITENGGLIFLSHLESKDKYSFEGLTGTEIYNRHYDAMDDLMSMSVLYPPSVDKVKAEAFNKLIEEYGDELLASQLDYPDLYLARWDKESQKQRVVGVAANDCHHNMVFVTKMVDENTVLLGTNVDPDDGMRRVTTSQAPGIPELTAGHQPGDIVVSLDLDPYYRSFFNVCSHLLADDLTEEAARHALSLGHNFVSHDWMCDATGFMFGVRDGAEPNLIAIMGDELPYKDSQQLVAESPVDCTFRLIKNGEEVSVERGRTFEHTPDSPGIYRLEAWLYVDGEYRSWVYTNPVYLR